MSSRYNEIKKSYCNLYCAGSPLVLSAYALLQDTETHTVILQVKMKSVAKKEISAVILEIEARDIIGKPLKGIPEYQFLDLSVSRDAEFGTSSAIILPDATTRDVTISCSSVVFSDGTAWSSDPNTSWKSIPTEKPLSDIFDDPEVLDYFIAENGSNQRFIRIWNFGNAPPVISIQRKKKNVTAAAGRFSIFLSRIMYSERKNTKRKMQRKPKRSGWKRKKEHRRKKPAQKSAYGSEPFPFSPPRSSL